MRLSDQLSEEEKSGGFIGETDDDTFEIRTMPNYPGRLPYDPEQLGLPEDAVPAKKTKEPEPSFDDAGYMAGLAAPKGLSTTDGSDEPAYDSSQDSALGSSDEEQDVPPNLYGVNPIQKEEPVGGTYSPVEASDTPLMGSDSDAVHGESSSAFEPEYIDFNSATAVETPNVADDPEVLADNQIESTTDDTIVIDAELLDLLQASRQTEKLRPRDVSEATSENELPKPFEPFDDEAGEYIDFSDIEATHPSKLARQMEVVDTPLDLPQEFTDEPATSPASYSSYAAMAAGTLETADAPDTLSKETLKKKKHPKTGKVKIPKTPKVKTPKVPKDTSDNGDKRRRLIVFLTLSAAAMLLLAVGIWKGPSLLGVFKPNSDSTQRGATDSLAKPSIQSETPKEAVATDDHAHGDVTGHHDEASDSTGKHSDVAVDEKPSEQKTSEVKEATQKTELIANGDGISKKKPLPESKTSSAQKAPTQKAPKKLTAIDGKVLKGTLASAKPKKTPSSALASAAQLKKQRLAERSRFDNALPLEKVSKQKITPAMLRDAPEDKNNPQYVVQLYSSPDRSDVEDYQKNLRKRKIDTDISDFQQKDRKWYRLRSQTFSSLNEAKNFARSLREPYWIDRVR